MPEQRDLRPLHSNAVYLNVPDKRCGEPGEHSSRVFFHRDHVPRSRKDRITRKNAPPLDVEALEFNRCRGRKKGAKEHAGRNCEVRFVFHIARPLLLLPIHHQEKKIKICCGFLTADMKTLAAPYLLEMFPLSLKPLARQCRKLHMME